MKSNYENKLIADVLKNLKNGNNKPDAEPMQATPAEERREPDADAALDAAKREKLIRDQFDLIRKQRELIQEQQKEIERLKHRRSW